MCCSVCGSKEMIYRSDYNGIVNVVLINGLIVVFLCFFFSFLSIELNAKITML